MYVYSSTHGQQCTIRNPTCVQLGSSRQSTDPQSSRHIFSQSRQGHLCPLSTATIIAKTVSPGRINTHMSSLTFQDEACAAPAVEVTAKILVQIQSERKKIRRTQAGGRRSSARTSLWSTIAETLKSFDTQHTFMCEVCRSEGLMNSNLPTSKITLHYNTKHTALHAALVNLNNGNAPELMLSNRINQERENVARRNRRHSIERFFHNSRQGTRSYRIL